MFVLRAVCRQKQSSNYRQFTHHTAAAQQHHHHKTFAKLVTQHVLIIPSSRHKRTHDRGDGDQGGFNLSGEEEEEYSGEDQLGPLDDASPTSEAGYMVSNGQYPSQVSNDQYAPQIAHDQYPPQGYNSLQTLSMPMTISQPHGMNAGGGIPMTMSQPQGGLMMYQEPPTEIN